MPGEPDFVTNTQINHDFKDSDIPQGLISETGLDTFAKIDARLKEEIKAKDSSFVNAVVQDVELVYSTDSGVTWTKGDRTHFPADGKLQVSLPVPDGTDPAKHDYIVLHMFTTSDFGKTPGDVERCEYTVRKDTDGKYYLDFYVTGLSPIIVGWKDKVSVPTPTPTPTPEPTPDPTLEPTPTPAPSFAALDEVPPTGDDLSTGLWIILMSISLAGMLAVLFRWKIRC